MSRLRIKKGQRVKILNLDNRFHLEYDDQDLEYFKCIIGQVGIFTGSEDESYWRDDVYHNYTDDDEDDDRTLERNYCIRFSNKDGDEDTIYLFKHNFEVLDSEPPKNDIEWLDRVQMNFKY